MRCIEMTQSLKDHSRLLWLTLTWDVLKYSDSVDNNKEDIRLTLTWDVLK